jgi:hypothetical protein
MRISWQGTESEPGPERAEILALEMPVARTAGGVGNMEIAAATQQQAELYCQRTGWPFDVIAEGAISIYGRPGKRRPRWPHGGRNSIAS